MTLSERAQLVWWQARPWQRRRAIDPVVEVLQRRSPMWCLLARLRRRRDLGHGWFEIPNVAASVHVHRRLDPNCRAREGDLIQIVAGRATAFGWIENDGRFASERLYPNSR